MKALTCGLVAGLLFCVSVHADNKRLTVPADSRAKYVLVDKGWQGGDRIVVTKRSSREGTRYTRWLFDCEKNSARVLGEGESLEAVATATAETPMGLIATGSIAYYIGLEACRYLRES